MKRPLFLTTVLFCLSVIAYKYFGLEAFAFALVFSVGIILFLIKKTAYIVLSVIILIGGFFSVKNADNKINSSKTYSADKYTLELTVISDEADSATSKYVTVKTNGNNNVLSNKKYDLFYRNADFICGQKLTAYVYFFDFQMEKSAYSISKGIYGNLWLVNVDKENGVDHFYFSLGKIRRFIKKFLNDYLSSNSAKTLTAIMLGDKSYLDEAFSVYVKRAEVSHIMAVSGLHLSVILGFSIFLFARFLRNKYIGFFFSVLSVFIVAATCGFTPSVLRAGFMFVIFAFAPLINKDTDTISVISFAVLALLLSSPMLLFNISFQMSVLAIVAVTYVTPFYYGKISSKLNNKFIKAFILAILVSVFATVFTMPVAIYNFEYISTVCILTNILISFPITLIIEFSLLGMLLSLVPVLSKIIMTVTDYITKYVIFVIEIFGKLKCSAIKVPKNCFVVPIFVIFILLVIEIIVERRTQNGSSI